MLINLCLIQQIFPVGMILRVNERCLGNKKETNGVVYHHYNAGNRQNGVSIILKNGMYDGFNATCLSHFNVVPIRIDPSLISYCYVNDQKLVEDYRNGVFNQALEC